MSGLLTLLRRMTPLFNTFDALRGTLRTHTESRPHRRPGELRRYDRCLHRDVAKALTTNCLAIN